MKGGSREGDYYRHSANRKPPAFTGEITEYRSWREAFLRMVHIQRVPVSHKAMALKESLDLTNLILKPASNNCNFSTEGYRQAFIMLETLFGGPERMADQEYEELMKLPTIRVRSVLDLATVIGKYLQYYKHLTSINQGDEFNTLHIYRGLKKTFPEEYIYEYIRSMKMRNLPRNPVTLIRWAQELCADLQETGVTEVNQAWKPGDNPLSRPERRAMAFVAHLDEGEEQQQEQQETANYAHGKPAANNATTSKSAAHTKGTADKIQSANVACRNCGTHLKNAPNLCQPRLAIGGSSLSAPGNTTSSSMERSLRSIYSHHCSPTSSKTQGWQTRPSFLREQIPKQQCH